MPAHEALSDVQFQYRTVDEGGRKPMHRIDAATDRGTGLGYLVWNSDKVVNIQVHGQFQRRGVGTAMWNEGHRVAEENARIPAPKHSADRTTAGDAWARSVGGRLPRRKK